MPVALEARLHREARRKFPHDRARQDRYVYGTLRKTGWRPRNERNTHTHATHREKETARE